MFGKMNVVPIINLGDAGHENRGSLDKAVERLLALTEYPAIAKWVQFPKALFLFLVVPEDSESGAFYVYDRRSGIWCWIDFDDEKFGGYNRHSRSLQNSSPYHIPATSPDVADPHLFDRQDIPVYATGTQSRRCRDCSGKEEPWGTRSRPVRMLSLRIAHCS